MTTISYVRRLPSLVTLVIELSFSLLTAMMLAMVAEAHETNGSWSEAQVTRYMRNLRGAQ